MGDLPESAQEIYSFQNAVFRDLFSTPKYLQQLYLSLHPENPEAASAIPGSVTTKIGHNNAVGFTILRRLVILVEASSDWSADMMLTMTHCTSETLERYLDMTDQHFGQDEVIRIPKEELYLLCTGNPKDRPKQLSFAEDFTDWEEPYLFDFQAEVLYRNGCRDILGQYTSFVQIYRELVRAYDQPSIAVQEIIRLCMDRDILMEHFAAHEKAYISQFY